MDEDEKPCRECGTVLPLIDFPVRSDQKDGHHWWCFPCKRAKDREYGETYRNANPDQVQRNARRYARKDAVRAARSVATMWKKYGLTPEMFIAKLAAQDGHCPFCLPGEVPKLWDIDHDHRCCPDSTTCGGCLRDILCHRHNQGLGFWDDDPAQLRAAADYIESWQAKITPGSTPRPVFSKSGEGHQAWRGDDAGPGGMRLRVYRAKGVASSCVNREIAGCTSERYEWILTANADAGDPSNYTSLCAACRMELYGMTGGNHANAKLTDEQAAEIRRLCRPIGTRTQVSLAAEYKISQAQVSCIVRGVSYKPKPS